MESKGPSVRDVIIVLQIPEIANPEGISGNIHAAYDV